MNVEEQGQIGPPVRSKVRPSQRILPLLAGLALLGGLQTATQLFAAAARYHDALGAHWGPVYAPWSILLWWARWQSQFPEQLMRASGVGLLVSALGLMAVAIAKVVASNTARTSDRLHGSARWAERRDIENAGLLQHTGSTEAVYVGAWQDKSGQVHYLRHSGPEHVLTYAPTRSGKGVGLVIPTLLSWGPSCVITDLKGELWALTAGWRQKHAGNKVLRFEPASGSDTVRWNPLDEIRLGTEAEVGDVQNLATVIVDPDGKGLNDHWQKTAFALLSGVILHALYKAQKEGFVATLASVDAMLADPSRDVGDLWQEMCEYHHLKDKNHPTVGRAGRDMIDRPPEEAGSVLSSAKSYLALYRDPVVEKNTNRSDFSIRQLMQEDSPVSLYIITQPNDKARLRPLVRVMVSMIVRLLADKLEFQEGRPVPQYKNRMLLMLDEFPSLGKIEILQESLAFIAGYGIKAYLICQDLSQLKSRETGYGQNESITSNCHIQNAYPPNRIETAEHLSRLTGQTTAIKEAITTSGRRAALMLGQVSKTYQEVQRPLLTPDECLRMKGPLKNAKGEIEDAGDMIVYAAGCPAIYGKQPLYFKDPVFLARAKVPAPKTSDILRAAQPDRSDKNWISL